MKSTTDDVERTSRDTAIAQWGVASVVMVGSAAAAGVSFHYLGEHWSLGVITALAVDLALAAWLLINQRLRAAGVTAATGLALEIATMGMTLFLNVGSAVFKGIDPATVRVLLGVAHSFLPIVLVLISMAGGEAHQKLAAVKRDREATEEAARAAQQRHREELERQRANGVLVDAQDYHREAVELREQAELELRQARQARTATEAEAAAARAAQEEARPLRRKRDNKSGSPVVPREERRAWVRHERAAGRNPTGADVDKRFGPPRTGAAIVTEVDKEITETKQPLRAVGGR